METREYIPFKAIHPGNILKDELDSRGISQKEFSQDIGMQKTMLNEIIKGKRAITAEIALILEKSLGIKADSWMRHQAGYELDCLRIQQRNINKTKQIETWKLIKQYVPVNIFNKLGLLTNSLADNISKIWDIYEVDSIDLLIERVSVHKNMVYYKKSEKLKNDQINIFAWSRLAQWQAKSVIVDPFDEKNKDAIIMELKTLFYINKNVVNKTKTILNKYGIKFLVIEKFNQSPIDGFSFWSYNNPAIVVTMRKKQLDNFAFTVLHELGHVFEHLRPNQTDEFLDIEYPNSDIGEKEQTANQFARQCFIDDTIWRRFINTNPKFDYKTTEKQMIQLASHLKIHPSIVLGRYCFETNQFAVKTEIDRTIN